MGKAGFLWGVIASRQYVIAACDSRLSWKPTYQSSLDAWQASNEPLLSEVEAIVTRARERADPVISDARAAELEREYREKTRNELVALSLKDAQERCDKTEVDLRINITYIRGVLEIVKKDEHALINLPSE